MDPIPAASDAAQPAAPPGIYRFDAFELDRGRGLLYGPEGEVSLRPQVFRLLELLVDEAPAVVSQQRLMDEVWGASHLCASSLPRGISELRSALGDQARRPRFIETVHRRGYRFVGEVQRRSPDAGTPDEGEPLDGSMPTAGADGVAMGRRWPIFGLAGSIGLLLLASGWLLRGMTGADGVPSALPLARPHPVAKKPQDPLDVLEAEHWDRFGLRAPTLDRDGTVEPGRAIEGLRAALVREPESPALWFQLARCRQEMGRAQEGREAAARALELSAGLPWEGRLMISALGDELAGDGYRAAARYRSLHQAHPDHLGLGLTLARALREGGRPERALELLDQLSEGPLGGSPRLELERAETHELLGDAAAMLSAAEVAVEGTATRGSPWLRARALDALAAARQRLEPGTEVEGLYTQAETTFELYGPSSRLLRVWQHRSEALALAGRLDEARLRAEQVIGVARRMENRKDLAWGLYLVGRVRMARAALGKESGAESGGELAAAETLFEQSIASFRAAGHLGGLATARLELARLHRERGSKEKALVVYGRALEAFEELGAEKGRRAVLRELAELDPELEAGTVSFP